MKGQIEGTVLPELIRANPVWSIKNNGPSLMLWPNPWSLWICYLCGKRDLADVIKWGFLSWGDFPGLSLWTHESLKETSLVKGSLGPQTWSINGYCKTIKGSPCRLMFFCCLKIVQRSLPCKTWASPLGPPILVIRLITRVKLQHNLVMEVLDQLRENEGMSRLT